MTAILPILKGTVGLATSLGAGAVVGNAIKATTPDNMKLAQKILVGIGGITLSSIAGDVASRYMEAQIQAVADGVHIAKVAATKVANATEAAAETFKDEVQEDDKPAQ